METIVRAKTCQNCRFGKFDQRSVSFGSAGKKINGLCMRYADAPMPRQPGEIRYYFFHDYRDPEKCELYELAVTMFKDIRIVEALPTWEMFNRYYLALQIPYRQQSEETVRGWYDAHYTWSAWWIRNWQAVAERRIDRTTCCDAWDGTQTSKFYREKKRKK
jgi:hypothetical protein